MNIEQYSKKFIHYYHLEIPRLLQKYLAGSKGNAFCDLGCGDGSLLYALNENGYFKDKVVFALDASEERINVAKQINPAFKCFKDDVCAIKNLQSQSIDFTVSTQVIEHIPDEECMIREIKRILKKDGLVYLTTVFKKRYGWYFYRCNGKWTIDPTHLREYTDDKPLLQLFHKYGFDILENKMTLLWFPLFDFILKRIGLDRKIYLKKVFHVLRQIKIPIIGYYSWEMVLKNNT
jgi:2-polyprenyl-3-methyl-5-hydroxy-6-metoxy-1,4-benzoquinol methylase